MHYTAYTKKIKKKRELHLKKYKISLTKLYTYYIVINVSK